MCDPAHHLSSTVTASFCFVLEATKHFFFATQEAANGRSDAGKMEGAKKAGSKLSVERVYQKKTQLEHILLRPDTYIGSVEPITQVRVASFQFLSHAGAI